MDEKIQSWQAEGRGIKEILCLGSEGSWHRGSLSEGIRGDPVLEVKRTWQSHAEPARMLAGQEPCWKRSTGEALSSEAAAGSPHKLPTPHGPTARSTHPQWLWTAGAEGVGQPLPQAWSSGQAGPRPCLCPWHGAGVRASPSARHRSGSGSRRRKQLQGQTNGQEPSA